MKFKSKSIKGKIRLVSPIAYFSNAMAILLFLSTVFIMSMLGFHDMQPLMIPVFCLYSIVLQTYFFKIKGMQESEWVDKKWLNKEHKLNFEQLNKYSRFNYKFYSFIKVFIALLVLVTPAHVSSGVNTFIVAIILSSFMLRKWLAKQGIIPIPMGFLKVRNHGNFQRSELDTANQLGSGITSYKSKDV